MPHRDTPRRRQPRQKGGEGAQWIRFGSLGWCGAAMHTRGQQRFIRPTEDSVLLKTAVETAPANRRQCHPFPVHKPIASLACSLDLRRSPSALQSTQHLGSPKKRRPPLLPHRHRSRRRRRSSLREGQDNPASRPRWACPLSKSSMTVRLPDPGGPPSPDVAVLMRTCTVVLGTIRRITKGDVSLDTPPRAARAALREHTR